MPTLRAPLTLAACATTLVGAVAAALLTSGPAAAGGPTSVLLSVPGQGQTASLYYTDRDYDALADLVGVDNASGTTRVDESGASHEAGTGVTVTWLIHDVMPWRVDHIYLEGKGAPWVATQVMTDETRSLWESPVVWHQPESGAQLERLLDRLGVGAVAKAAGDFDGVAGAPLPDTDGSAEPPAAAAAAPAAASEAAETSALTGVWWALAGLAGGVLLTTLWLRVRARRQPDGPEAPDDEPSEAGSGVKEWLTAGA